MAITTGFLYIHFLNIFKNGKKYFSSLTYNLNASIVRKNFRSTLKFRIFYSTFTINAVNSGIIGFIYYSTMLTFIKFIVTED